MSPIEILSLSNKSFCAYLICVCILVIKMIALATFTGFKRITGKVFHSPEDAAFFKGQVQVSDVIERFRRAHLNDLENIPIFWISALLYLFTKPPLALSCFLFFTFTIIRIAHTIVYIGLAKQPARFILFSLGATIVLYMALHAMIVGFIHI